MTSFIQVSCDTNVLYTKASCPSLVHLLMIDVNARVGSVHSECFGTVSSDIESHNGMLLRSTLTATGLLAVNTVWCPGYTWRSPQGCVSRIDYVCVPNGTSVQCLKTWIESGVDISLGAREDHRVLGALFKIRDSCKTTTVRTQNLTFNRNNLTSPQCLHKFQNDVWKCTFSADANIDEHASSLNRCIENAAVRVFGKQTNQPSKPWISGRTWSCVKYIAPYRRLSYRAFDLTRKLALKSIFFIRASSVHVAYDPSLRVPLLGWGTACELENARSQLAYVWKVNALGWSLCRALQAVA